VAAPVAQGLIPTRLPKTGSGGAAVAWPGPRGGALLLAGALLSALLGAVALQRQRQSKR
jgi:hypothetical protein